MNINICEIFYSLQGETTTAGFPAVFVRLSGCNLRCTYCDTKYSYNINKEISIDEAIEKIKNYNNIHHICITGGEPLLQENLKHLVDKLISLRYSVQIETNGSQLLNEIPEAVRKIVDIKGPSSGEKNSFRIENLNFLTKNDEVKFVVADMEDFNFAHDFIKKQLSNCKSIINISPSFGKLEPTELANLILKNNLNVRLNIQLHKIIWPQGEPGTK